MKITLATTALSALVVLPSGASAHASKGRGGCAHPGKAYTVQGVISDGGTLRQVAGSRTNRKSDDRYSGTVVVDVSGGTRDSDVGLDSFTVAGVRLQGASALPDVGADVSLTGVSITASAARRCKIQVPVAPANTPAATTSAVDPSLDDSSDDPSTDSADDSTGDDATADTPTAVTGVAISALRFGKGASGSSRAGSGHKGSSSDSSSSDDPSDDSSDDSSDTSSDDSSGDPSSADGSDQSGGDSSDTSTDPSDPASDFSGTTTAPKPTAPSHGSRH